MEAGREAMRAVSRAKGAFGGGPGGRLRPFSGLFRGSGAQFLHGPAPGGVFGSCPVPGSCSGGFAYVGGGYALPGFFAGRITPYLRRTTFSAWRRKRSPSIFHHQWSFVQPSRRRERRCIAKVNAPPPLGESTGKGLPAISSIPATIAKAIAPNQVRLLSHSTLPKFRTLRNAMCEIQWTA